MVHLTRSEVAEFPVSEITIAGKTVQAGVTVDDARRAFASSAVQVVPVLEGARYLGAVDRGTIEAADGGAALSSVAQALVPQVLEGERAGDALAALDAHGATRLVVVGEDGRYVGIVCLRGDRERLCIDAARLRVLA